MGLLQILFGFGGRIRRTTFWLAGIGWHLAFGVIFAAVAVVAGVGAAVTSLALGHFHGLFSLFVAPVFLPLWLLTVWVDFALGVKRCHDRGYPGLMVLIYFVPVIGWLWAVIDLGFIDGTPGPNVYGPSPKGWTGYAT